MGYKHSFFDAEKCADMCETCLIIVVFVMPFALLITFFFLGMASDDHHPYSPVEFNIIDASIMRFNLTNNNTLYYNFKINIAAINFNDEIAYYQKAIAISSYKGNEIGLVSMAPPLVLGQNNIVLLGPIVFEGNIVIKLESQQLFEYNDEARLGVYNLDFELYPIVHCLGLRIPFISSGELTPTFNVTACS